MADSFDDDDDFGALLAQYDQEQALDRKVLKIGEKASGKILSIGVDVAFVDLGAKAEGIIHCDELLDEDGDLTVDVGDRIEGVIAGTDESGSLVLKVRAARGEAAKQELRMAFEQQLPVEGLVEAVNKGGFEVKVAGQRAFCPISQISDRYVETPEEFIGQRLEFRIQRFEDKGRHTNVVVSRRALLEEEAAKRADALRQRLEVGATLEGTVTSVTSYGAFIDLGGLEGLLHVSEMSFQRVEDPSQIVSQGQRLEVQVKSIEAPKKEGQNERISLSIRALLQDPWKDVERRFPIGSEIDGRVTRLESYGAFVELAPGVEGLAHISKLGSAERLSHARQLLELGQTVRVEVLDVETGKRRISLARKAEMKRDDADRGEYEEFLEREPSRQSSGGGGFGSGAFGDLGKMLEKKKS